MDQLEQRLGTLLREAEVPPVPTDVGKAVADGRGTVTRRRFLATGVVAAATAVALVGVPAVMDGMRDAGPVVVPPASELPDEIRRPDSRPPSLPDSGPVGRAVLIYKWGPTWWGGDVFVAVMADGRQYQLPEYGTISPDGAWYGHPRGQEDFLVRDLTGTRTWTVKGDRTNLLWSPDGRWLVLAHPEDRPPGMEQQGTKYVDVLDTRTGEVHRVDGVDPLRYGPVAMLNSGELIYGAGIGEDAIVGDDVDLLELRWVDVRSGEPGKSLRMDLEKWPRGKEQVRTTEGPMLRVAPDGRTAIVGLTDRETGRVWPVALLVVDLSEKSVRRIDYPRSSEQVDWRVVQVRGDSTALETRMPYFPVEDPTTAKGALLSLDLATGERRTVCRLYGIDPEGMFVRGQGVSWL